MASTVQGGTLIFKINGVPYALAGTFSYDLGGYEREARVGPDGVHGTVGKFRAPMIDCEFQDGPNVSVSFLQSIDGVTMTAELANGIVFVMTGAAQVGDCAKDVVEAKIKTKFAGQQAQEFTS